MNTFWLKIAGVAVGIVLVIFLVSFFTSGSDSEPKEPQKTIYDQWEEDDKRLRAEPQSKELPKTSSPVPPPGKTVEQTPQPGRTVEQAPPPEQRELRFKKLNEIEKVQAERLWEWVMNQRKMGRLPVMGYKKMVDNCREIIQRWPESIYAFWAKRALADLPPRYHKMYNITKEEIDLGNMK
jgi:type IV secretory pathway VirB10-like protein